MSGTSRQTTQQHQRLSKRTSASHLAGFPGQALSCSDHAGQCCPPRFPRCFSRDQGRCSPVAPTLFSAQPADQGLYRSEHEHDACGVALIATMRGSAGHDIVDHALTALRNLEHRGATGADPLVGDGAGILTQIPDAFLREVVDFDAARARARTPWASPSCRPTSTERAAAVATIESLAAEEGLRVLGWRDVPVSRRPGRRRSPATACRSSASCSSASASGRVGRHRAGAAGLLPAQARRARGRTSTSRRCRPGPWSTRACSPPASSSRSSPTCPTARFATELALVHSRFSTNTFPSWPLAHPYRHDRAQRRDQHRQGQPQLDAGPGEPAGQRRHPRRPRAALPDLHARAPRDSATFDEVLELLHLGGRSLPHAVLMMIPEAWENHAEMDPARRAFYEFHSTFMEPWDGPACVTFTDGTVIGAVLDRNGLRPGPLLGHRRRPGRPRLRDRRARPRARPAWSARAGCSPAGCSSSTPSTAGWSATTRSSPTSAAEHPYDEWLHAGDDQPRRPARARAHRPHRRLGHPAPADLRLHRRRSCGSCSAPMARSGAEPLGSMGTDTPDRGAVGAARGCSSTTSPSSFAQVTNPPLDAIREELVTSLGSTIGPEGNALDRDAGARPPADRCRSRCIDNDELAKIVHINADGDLPGYATVVVRGLYDVPRRRRRAARAAGGDLRRGLRGDRRRRPVRRPLRPRLRPRPGADPVAAADLGGAPPPASARRPAPRSACWSRPATSARSTTSPLLIGYGAAAVNPYLAMESVEDLVRSGELTGVTADKAVANLIKALGKGVLKVMSKMGISTVASYRGAQVFEAIGLAQDLVDRVLHRHASPSSAASAWTSSPPRSRPGTRRPTRPTASSCRTAGSTSAASTSGAARASRTCSTPRRCSGCSTPPASGATTSSSSTPPGSTSSPSG